MDDADLTQERMEKEMALRLRVRRPELQPTGSCHNCDEAVLADAKFCDVDCRHDYERREKNRP
jgi:hypothetical protein